MAQTSKPVKKVPAGYHTVTPYLVCRDAARAIDFYRKAFGAEEKFRMPGQGGKVMHCELQLGDSVIMLSDEFPEMGSKSPQALGGTPGGLMVYSEDVDALFKRATDAGCTVKMPLMNMFWGDRYGKLEDPFGHSWAVATHIEDVAPDEMQRRMQAEMQKMQQQKG